MTAAQLIVDELLRICSAEALNEFRAAYDDECGCASLDQYRSLLSVRLGRDYRESAWGPAMAEIAAMASVAEHP